MFERATRMSRLHDFYGGLLTSRQRRMIELKYELDWSLGEIAADLGTTRQAAYDSLRRAESSLETFEQVLGLAAQAEDRARLAREAGEQLDSLLQEGLGETLAARLERIKAIVEELGWGADR
ncbi:MAG: sigma factor-like helix-turn-helix DNA-binding protein [Bacillota bacterium]